MRIILAIVMALGIIVPTIAAPGDSRDGPIPYQKYEVIEDFEMRIALVYPDATESIMDFIGRRAVEPDDGNVYALITVEATYVGDGVGKPYDIGSPSFIWKDGNTELTSIGCPDGSFWELNGRNSDADVFPEGEVELYYCVEIPKGELGNLLMYFETGNREFVFFDLTPTAPTPATPVATPAT